MTFDAFFRCLIISALLSKKNAQSQWYEIVSIVYLRVIKNFCTIFLYSTFYNKMQTYWIFEKSCEYWAADKTNQKVCLFTKVTTVYETPP